MSLRILLIATVCVAATSSTCRRGRHCRPTPAPPPAGGKTEAGRPVVKAEAVADFSESRINLPVDPGEFTWEAMGVPDGCRVVDERPGKDRGKAIQVKARQKVTSVGSTPGRES